MHIDDKRLRIRSICDQIDIPVDSTNPHSKHLLHQLWDGTIGIFYQIQGYEKPPYTPVSPYWKLLGFQRETPLTDFRGGGILSLEQLVCFVESHPRFVLALIKEAKLFCEENTQVDATDSQW